MCFDVGIAIKNRKCLLESVSIDSFIARPHTDTERGGGERGEGGTYKNEERINWLLIGYQSNEKIESGRN